VDIIQKRENKFNLNLIPLQITELFFLGWA